MEVEQSVPFRWFIGASCMNQTATNTQSPAFKGALEVGWSTDPLTGDRTNGQGSGSVLHRDRGSGELPQTKAGSQRRRCATLRLSLHLHTPSLRQALWKNTTCSPFQVSDAHPCWLTHRLWKVGKVFWGFFLLWKSKSSSDPCLLQWVPLGECFHTENVSAFPKERLINTREPPFLYIKWPPNSSKYWCTASSLHCSPSGAFFPLIFTAIC